MTPERPLGNKAIKPSEDEEPWRIRVGGDVPPGWDVVYLSNPILGRHLLKQVGVELPTLSERLLELGDRLATLVRRKTQKS